MRSFFWLLLLVNVGYFAWRQFAPATDEQSEPLVQQEVPKLSLISELPQQPEARLGNAPNLPGQVSSVPTGSDSRVNAEEPEIAEENEPVDRPAIATAPGGSAVESSRTCAVVGGFTASDPALALVRTLKDADIESYTLSGDESATSVWWVYLPKFASEDLARRTLTELREKGIDSYYLDSGELAGGISLGVFSRPEGAQRTQAELARRGYSASIQEVARAATRFRVVVETTREALMAESGMLNFLENNPGLDVSDFVCEGVAEPN